MYLVLSFFVFVLFLVILATGQVKLLSKIGLLVV